MEATKKRKRRIAIDGHVLLQKEKTGVGQTAQYLIDELVRNRDLDIQINFVDFLGYRCHRLIRHYKRQGCRIKFCWWLPYSVYDRVFEKFEIPYYWMFGRKNSCTLFFEYKVPYKVGTKVVNYVHDVNYKVYPETMEKSALKWLEENLPVYCDRSDVIITVSEFSKREIIKYMDIKDDQIQVVLNGVDCEKYNRNISLNQVNAVKRKYGIEGEYILYMGTLEPRKNIGVLIEAYHILAEHDNSLPKLVIAGKKGWMYEPLFQMVQKFALENQVIFTGYIEDKDSPALMSGAEVFAFPSLYEGFGIPPLEAMACGTPVIVSDAEALLEATGECAVTFRSGDAADLSSKIGQLLQNREERERLSAAGWSWAKRHTWEKAGERLGAVLAAV